MWSIVCTSSSTLLTESTNALKSLRTQRFLTTLARRGKIKSMHASSSPKRETDPKKRIVITGMGLVSVFGSDIDTYYNKLLDGVSGITPIDRFDTSDFSVKIAGQIRDFSSEGYIDAKDDRRLDDCWRYCLVAGKKALDDATLSKELLEDTTMERTRMGVLVGSAMGGNTIFRDGVENLLQKGQKKMSPYFIPYSIASMGSALLAIDAGFMGPTYSISTACATANHCFIAAANHIRRGEADVMMAGASDAGVTLAGIGGCSACRALSTRNDQPHRASRPWDIHRDGFVMGEGAGILIMESMEHAMKRGARGGCLLSKRSQVRVLSATITTIEYLGGAATCDAHHITDPQPDGLGVASCMIKSLKDAGVAAEEVNYVNAHATSTRAGDLPEIKAIKKVFKNSSELKLNATKSIIGHELGAAGGLEAIATIKAINTGWLHPTLNQDELEAEVTIDTVPNVKKQHQVNVAISNSFGFGGHNSVAVLAPFSP